MADFPKYVVPAIKLTGGVKGCLDAINANDVVPGGFSITGESGFIYFHRLFQETVNIPANPPYVVKPVLPVDTYRRWRLLSMTNFSGDIQLEKGFSFIGDQIKAIDSDGLFLTNITNQGLHIKHDGDVELSKNLIIETEPTLPNHAVTVGWVQANSPDISKFKSGVFSLPNSSTTAVITFPVPYADTNYSAIWGLTNIVDSSPSLYTATIIEKTNQRFTLLFSDSIDSSNYELNWWTSHS